MAADQDRSAIMHRYDAGLHFDRITAPCAACEREWPCDLAGHKGYFGYSAIHDEETWRCSIDCPHPSHSGSEDPDEAVGPCARCGHDPACGFASVNGDWLCHDDDHSCYFEDSVDRASSGSRGDDLQAHLAESDRIIFGGESWEGGSKFGAAPDGQGDAKAPQSGGSEGDR